MRSGLRFTGSGRICCFVMPMKHSQQDMGILRSPTSVRATKGSLEEMLLLLDVKYKHIPSECLLLSFSFKEVKPRSGRSKLLKALDSEAIWEVYSMAIGKVGLCWEELLLYCCWCSSVQWISSPIAVSHECEAWASFWKNVLLPWENRHLRNTFLWKLRRQNSPAIMVTCSNLLCKIFFLQIFLMVPNL